MFTYLQTNQCFLTKQGLQSPVKPLLLVQKRVPLVFVNIAFWSQLSVWSEHSVISRKVNIDRTSKLPKLDHPIDIDCTSCDGDFS